MRENLSSKNRSICTVFTVFAVLVNCFLYGARSSATPANDDMYLSAPLPSMGWNPWNSFGCNTDESLIRSSALQMKRLGLASAGYNTLTIDDCWMYSHRDQRGYLEANTAKFPHGMENLVEFIHGLGMKIGLYESPGESTCGLFNAGSLGHYREDAAFFVGLGIDFLKFDLCMYEENINNQISYFSHMRSALIDSLAAKVRRGLAGPKTLIYSINPNSILPYSLGFFRNDSIPVGMKYHWATISNSWRIVADVSAQWHISDESYFAQGVSDVIQQAIKSVHMGIYSRKNHWMDLDMLEIGNGNLTFTENKTHLLMWALFSSPLFLGCNLTRLSQNILDLVKNPRIIAIDQSVPIGRVEFLDNNSFFRKLPNNIGKYVIVQYNSTDTVQRITTQLPGPEVKNLTEVFSGTRENISARTLTNNIEPHGVAAYIVNYS